MGLRSRGEVEAVKMPTGLIPKYGNLKRLFRETLGKSYFKEDYIKQFTLRIPENLKKLERINNVYCSLTEVLAVVFEVLEEQRRRLKEARKKHENYVPPTRFAAEP